jgi:hypothetical protein
MHKENCGILPNSRFEVNLNDPLAARTGAIRIREPFCAVVVNFFYERHLLFRSGRKRKL